MNNVTPVSSTNPTRIIPAAPGSRHVIRNLSPGTIYLDSITSVSASSFPLLAGEGCIWQDPKGCVALAAPTNTSATVGISDSLESPLGLQGVQGARLSQTVASGATANAVSVVSNAAGTLTTTVIPASAQSIELHNANVTTTTTGPGTAGSGKLIRSDTGANLIVPQAPSAPGTITQSKDFQGTLLPPGVSVQSVCFSVGGQTTTVSVDLNYNLVG